MKRLYLDCAMGAAGDMLSASLLELCPDRDAALAQLNALGIPNVEYIAEQSEKCGITGTHLRVLVKGEEEHCDHHHDHDHGHEHEHHEHHHEHHSLADITALIDSLNALAAVKQDAKAVYGLIASAEAKVHGKELENIHFHEVGTMDAVADVMAFSLLKNILAPDVISASKVRTGFGSVRCAHGILPVPAPATALLLEGIPVFAGDIECEMCTPTGAAILRHFCAEFGEMPDMTVINQGFGMGTKSFPQRPNAVRAILGECGESVVELCCNVDDMSPEAVGFAIDTLLREGALDAWYTAIGMKKNRPGLMLSCLCRENDRDRMVELIFRHTQTLGIRESLCRRYVLKREQGYIETPYGAVRVKRASGCGVEREKPEFEDLAQIARETGLSLEEVKKAIGIK